MKVLFVIASEARQSSSDGGTGLLRFARNDEGNSGFRAKGEGN
jgi:hypothetical protein